MCAACYLSASQFKCFSFFIRCNYLSGIRAGHQRSPLHRALCISFGIFKDISAIYEPVISDSSLSTDTFSNPGNTFTSQNCIGRNSYAVDCQSVIEGYSAACFFNNSIFCITRLDLERISSGYSCLIYISCAEVIRRCSNEGIVRIVNFK